MRKVVLPVALAVACLGVVACGSTSQGSSAGGGGEFHLGAMADLTGPSAQTGRSLMNGIKASVEGINARGGVDGRKIALTTRDDGNAQATGVSGIRALIGQKDVLGVLGVNSSFVASTVAPLLQKTKTPMASVAFPPELVSPPRDGIYMTIAKQDAQGAAQIDFVKQLSQSGRLPKNPRVALLRFDSPASQPWAKGAKSAAAKDGLDVVTDQAYALGAKDVSSQAIRIAGAHADVVLLFILPTEASMVLNAANAAGLGHSVPMVGFFAASSKQFMQQMHGRPYYGLADFNYTNGSPLAAHIIGKPDIGVIPGIVLISLTRTSPSEV